MPLLGRQEAQHPNAQQWHAALKVGLRRRIRAVDLANPLRELAQRYRTSADDIAEIIVGFRAPNGAPDDPLLMTYIEHLIELRYIGTSNLLTALLRHSRYSKREQVEEGNDGAKKTGPPAFEEAVFTLLARLNASGEASHNLWKVSGIVYAITRWLTACNDFEIMKQLEAGGLHAPDPGYLTAYEALGMLTLTILGNQAFRNIEQQSWWKEKRSTVVTAMKSFVTLLSQSMQSRVAPQLLLLTNMSPYAETGADGLPVFAEDQIRESISDLPVLNSRAGLYVWLNALLCARPLTDDFSMLNHLQARYNGDTQPLTVDLLVAAFDCLTNALLRRDGRQFEFVIRSFICNKLPMLLVSLSASMFGASTVESCIQMGFVTISMDPLSPLTANSVSVRETLKITRLEFLQSCALHALISDGAVASILQEPPMAFPRVTRHTKDTLVSQCVANAGKVESLVDDLGSMQGNGGAIAEALILTVQNLCVSKDTMSLKTVCSALSRRMTNMDVVMQYTTPSSLLLPMCTLLNEWTHDEDQSEYQPPYEEFASVLLLILATVYRYGLSKSDIGLSSDDTFISKLLQRLASSISTEDLSDEQSKQLSKWIQGLYATDEHGETTGIGDEVMSHCPPQDFYLLVPTLFEQSVQACKTGVLSMNTFKGGLEFLLEPFLLPSLIGGLSWLVKDSWEDHGDAQILVQILQKLLRPASSSQDTQAMHKAILSIVATPLERSLQDLNRRLPDRKEVSTLIESLKPYLNRQRTTESSVPELGMYCAATAEGGLAGSLRNTFQDLVVWASQGGIGPPVTYTPRMIINATEILGARAVLDTIIAELKAQVAAGNGSIAMDVATAMVSAPTVDSQVPALTLNGSASPLPSEPQISVRTCLRLQVSDAKKLLGLKFDNAEALIRLGRRVEAQLAVSQLTHMPMQIPLQDVPGGDLMQSLDLTGTDLDGGLQATEDQNGTANQTATADFNSTDLAAAMAQPLDLSNATTEELSSMADPNAMQLDPDQNIFSDMNFDFTQQTQDGQNTDGNVFNTDASTSDQEEDIFADLDMGGMGDMGDFNF